jgi:hypothetical protein
MFVFRLADDQRHTLQAFRFAGLQSSRGKAKQGSGESCQPRLPEKITLRSFDKGHLSFAPAPMIQTLYNAASRP